jgi:hypothetical protein
MGEGKPVDALYSAIEGVWMLFNTDQRWIVIVGYGASNGHLDCISKPHCLFLRSVQKFIKLKVACIRRETRVIDGRHRQKNHRWHG